MDTLPDLSDKLQAYGIYEEYANHRRNYLNWRSGGSKGARGELSQLDAYAASRADPYEFERWYPTPEKFQFFFTVAYWKSVTTLVGSLIFTITSSLVLGGQRQWKPLVKWGEFIGATVYTVSAYLTYLELINVPDKHKSERRMVYFFPHWPDVHSRVSWNSLTGTLVQGCGALLYQVAVTAELCISSTSSAAMVLLCIHVPATLGGVAFFVGGLCELSHMLIHAEKVEVFGASASALDTIGGLAFLLGALPGLLCHSDLTAFIGVAYLSGSVVYTVSSVILLKMWKSNDFGLTLLSQLNLALHARRQSSGSSGQGAQGIRLVRRNTLPGLAVFAAIAEAADEQGQGRQKFSLRGVAFLTLMCWLLVAMAMNLLIGTLSVDPSHDFHLASLWGMNLVGVLTVAVLLVVHSTVTSVPREQPFKFAMQATRSIVVLAAVCQTRALLHEFGAFAGVPPGPGPLEL